jgi:hypothetical protein
MLASLIYPGMPAQSAEKMVFGGKKPGSLDAGLWYQFEESRVQKAWVLFNSFISAVSLLTFRKVLQTVNCHQISESGMR